MRSVTVFEPETLAPRTLSRAEFRSMYGYDMHRHIAGSSRTLRQRIRSAHAKHILEIQSGSSDHQKDLPFRRLSNEILAANDNFWPYEEVGDAFDLYLRSTWEYHVRHGSRHGYADIGLGGHDRAPWLSTLAESAASHHNVLPVPYMELTLHQRHILLVSSRPELLREIFLEKASLDDRLVHPVAGHTPEDLEEIKK